MFEFLGFQAELSAVLWSVSAWILISLATLFTYRLTLHPLAKYPGPLLAKLTSFYGVYHAYLGDIHLDLQRLHEKHGDFVRYEPNAVSVASVDGFHDIYNPGKDFRKSNSYQSHGPGSLIGLRDKAAHAQRKRIFIQGFSDAAIREHEPKILELVNVLCEKLLENVSPTTGWTTAKNLTEWCTYFTVDVITRIVFTANWELLLSAKNRDVLVATLTLTSYVGMLHQSALLYTFPFILMILTPKIAMSVPVFRQHVLNLMQRSIERREANPDEMDNFKQYMTAKDPVTGTVLPEDAIRTNSVLMVIAGSDTSAVALASTFFYLARYPDAYRKVATEVRAAFPSIDTIRAGPALNNCVYLRAAINEAMRLTPPASQPLWRLVETAGAKVGTERFPAGVNVGTCLYVLHHTKSFANPHTYDPDRWIPKNDSEEEKLRIKELTRSFAPFSMGTRQCLAKNFAMMEMLLCMANVFSRTDFEVAGTLGEDEKGNFRFKSFFTSSTEGPLIRFRERKT